MAIVGGPQNMPGLPQPSPLQDYNALGNDEFNRGNYRDAIALYNRALGTHLLADMLTSERGSQDPLVLWNRSAAYVLLGNYRNLPPKRNTNDRCGPSRHNPNRPSPPPGPTNPLPSRRNPNTSSQTTQSPLHTSSSRAYPRSGRGTGPCNLDYSS